MLADMNRLMTLLLLGLGGWGLTGCDPERRKKCEWYLVPDPERKGQVDEGMIPVCARNYISNKQDCRLQTTLKYAKKLHKKTFRYVDLKVENYGLPRTIKEITLCKED